MSASWFDKAVDYINNQQWGDYAQLCQKVEEDHIANNDFDGLVQFYDAGLRRIATDEDYNRIRLNDVSGFTVQFSRCLDEALDKARRNPAVKALYFEYYYDGTGDANDGNFFLCEDFDPDDDSWGSDFGKDGVVPGFDVSPYIMNIDPDDLDEMDEAVTQMGERYSDAWMLVACLKEIKRRGGIGYPFGFAQHNWPMTIYNETVN